MAYLRSPRSFGLVLFASLALAAVGLALAPRTALQGQTIPQTPRPEAQFPTGAVADSNNTMIAVTGVDLTGTSILYLVDTVNRQLAVYQASGGSESTQGVKLVGARRIDLDLQLYGFNDKSEYSYEDLAKKFAENRPAVPPVK